jgi:radical SAM superfamily enzyme YgiQ (UPF0313 family)
MRRAKVLLLDLKTYYPSPPYQLGLLVEYARLDAAVRRNVDFVFHAAPRERTPRELAYAILSADCDLVALSSYAWSHERIAATLELLEHADARLPWIVLGGPNASGRFGEQILQRHRSVSALVEGEGEPAFRDICTRLVDDPTRDPFAGARNCVVRDGNGGVRRQNIGHRIQHLDEVPSPYLSGLLPTRPSPIFYETNRGCPYRCAFCYWGNGNAKVYRMSLERIRAEMELFAKSGVSSFWIADANFGIFPSDAEIAATLAEINQRHGRPFRHVGVNWAKQSSDRVLEIARIFRDGGMGCTTTIALQSVTAEAERTAKRYSLPPARFATLVRHAARQSLDTYTDMICGLPGETVDEFVCGLEAVVATGVPAIMIHQLYLIPGTEFFDRRDELGLVTLPEGTLAATGCDAGAGEHPRSDFARYVVVRHPHMTVADQARGARLIGINHVLHNHDLGRPVILYLARHGLRLRDAYDFFDGVLLGRVPDLSISQHDLVADLRDCIVGFADDAGRDPYVFHARLSRLLWFELDADGRRRSRASAVLAFLKDLFEVLCQAHALRLDADEKLLLDEIIRYAVLVSPKPAWRPELAYAFTWDVDRIWTDMQTTLHEVATQDGHDWASLSASVTEALRGLLTSDYLDRQRTSPRYRIVNPWRIPPLLDTADWLLGSRSKHCAVERA